MLKLTVSPGEFLMIGKEIKIIFAGGEKKQIPIAIEAPREYDIVRSNAVDTGSFENLKRQPKPYVERGLSDEAKKKITSIVAQDRRKQRTKAGVDSAKAGRDWMKAGADSAKAGCD